MQLSRVIGSKAMATDESGRPLPLPEPTSFINHSGCILSPSLVGEARLGSEKNMQR